jgi:ribosomal protein S18 acetylase RimI-like enzyme
MSDGKNTIQYTIRPANVDDLEAMREICVETSSLPMRDEKDRQFLLLSYCDPYLSYGDCFVALNENGRVIGYILCAANTREFLKLFSKNIQPQISKLGIRYALTTHGSLAAQKLLLPLAPAHLHIDLTESARRKGIGTALINTLKEHLSARGIDRVQLTCGSKNKAAIAFYKRNGFKTVVRCFGVCVMRRSTD